MIRAEHDCLANIRERQLLSWIAKSRWSSRRNVISQHFQFNKLLITNYTPQQILPIRSLRSWQLLIATMQCGQQFSAAVTRILLLVTNPTRQMRSNLLAQKYVMLRCYVNTNTNVIKENHILFGNHLKYNTLYLAVICCIRIVRILWNRKTPSRGLILEQNVQFYPYTLIYSHITKFSLKA